MKKTYVFNAGFNTDEIKTANDLLSKFVKVFDDAVEFPHTEPWVAHHRFTEDNEFRNPINFLYAYSSLLTESSAFLDWCIKSALNKNNNKLKYRTLYLLEPFDKIDWKNIDMDLLDKVFKNNYLYTLEENSFEQVDIDKLIRKYK